MSQQEKQKIRKKMFAILKNKKEEHKLKKSQAIQKKLFLHNWFKQARTVMFYVSLDFEVDTIGMISKAKKIGKSVVVPRILKKTREMAPCVVTDLKKDLETGPYSIRQPKGSCRRAWRLEDIDLIIVPAVAFDKKGNRLGRGKGYYDRFLSSLPRRIPTIGLAFKSQILPQIPIGPSDIPVDKVIAA